MRFSFRATFSMLVGVLATTALWPAVSVADIATGTPVFSWTQPTQWSDGAPLTAAQITGYRLVCSGPTPVDRRTNAAAGIPPIVTSVAERYAPGAYSCTLAVYARRTPTTAEVISAATNPVTFTVPQPVPGAPTGFSVE